MKKLNKNIILFLCLWNFTLCSEKQKDMSGEFNGNQCSTRDIEIRNYFKVKLGSNFKVDDYLDWEIVSDDEGKLDDKALEYTCCFPKLNTLIVSRSKDITDFGVKKFVECRLKNNNQRMYEINFQATSITNESIKSLSQLSGIGTFYLDENRINNDSISYFAKFKSIGQLSIVATDITEAGAEKLRKMKHIQGVDSEYHVPANQE
ncbi:hypothetical protein LEP1GSC021_2582 [Leptospira noguchii str. 1993005606]|uniref:Uncharacterized protein n=2 Tax=Leptospira noguchii TaxID=28182 RepID=M6Y9Z1_9LEPT|nr:hypothetical protein [Leptospira noguchii]EMN00727.1 hypothetical protein LEP1GSC035_0367 [Leptospira noguchii str. 2007001578]EMO91162.1 hypothetical protein LEP1GSC024_1878 [Leptospira noguchii str. 2001034031]EPE86629.1 hypothetical protein LEP1GSC021_2582 [Leptospira noguchii str. 1993005606]UOG32680.1 hypothetical protein MAL06_20160 [Leptospira noguchii]